MTETKPNEYRDAASRPYLGTAAFILCLVGIVVGAAAVSVSVNHTRGSFGTVGEPETILCASCFACLASLVLGIVSALRREDPSWPAAIAVISTPVPAVIAITIVLYRCLRHLT